MIKGLIILSNSGIPLFYKSYGCVFDEDLLSNFLVANHIFGAQMIGESMNKIQMKEKTQFVFEKDDNSKLIFVVIADVDDHLFYLQLKLKHIKYMFIRNFPDIYGQFLNHEAKSFIIPNKEEIERVIDPIILTYKSFGNILDIVNFFGCKKTATIFSSLFSKQNLVVSGHNSQLIEKIILTFPLFFPFREFYITNEITSVEKIGLLIPWIEEFDLSDCPDCWWVIGTENNDHNHFINKSITFIDSENKKIINGIAPSFYENYLIESIKNVKDPQIANLIIANKMQDLLNIVKKLVEFNPINEELLKLHDIPTYFLPVIEKIIKLDISIELEVDIDYFSKKLNKAFGV